jgi:hypothetical protein
MGQDCLIKKWLLKSGGLTAHLLDLALMALWEYNAKR